MGRDKGIEILLQGLTFPEGPRWHDGKLWFSDFYPHRVIRLATDGKHVRAAWDEQPRQLAGAGCQIEHGAAGAKAEPRDDRFDRGDGVVGPSALVDVGRREAPRGRMELRHGSTGRGR